MYVTKSWDARTYQAKKKNPVTSAGFFETKDSVAAPVSFTILHIEAPIHIIIIIIIIINIIVCQTERNAS
jgi:hypothetical protein